MFKPHSSVIIFSFYILLIGCLSNANTAIAQNSGDYIRSREGKPMLLRKLMLSGCLKNFKKDRNDKAAVAVCDCYLDKIDKHFTNKQYKENTKNRIIDFPFLINKDEIIKNRLMIALKIPGNLY